jgi:hypothetical protein
MQITDAPLPYRERRRYAIEAARRPRRVRHRLTLLNFIGSKAFEYLAIMVSVWLLAIAVWGLLRGLGPIGLRGTAPW